MMTTIDTFDYKRARGDSLYWQEWNADPARVMARHAVISAELSATLAEVRKVKAQVEQLDLRRSDAVVRSLRGRVPGDGRDLLSIAPVTRLKLHERSIELARLHGVADRLHAELFGLEFHYPAYFKHLHKGE